MDPTESVINWAPGSGSAPKDGSITLLESYRFILFFLGSRVKDEALFKEN
jgi:hypothetical protein